MELSPEAIEILKLAHGKMWLKFKTEKEVWAFWHRVQNPDFFEKELGGFQLGDCFDWPKYMWPDDNEEDYWYINITEYGWGAANLLKTLGVI